MENIVDSFESHLNKYIPDSYKFAEIKRKELNNKVQFYKARFENLLKHDHREMMDYKPHCIFDLLFLAETESPYNDYYIQFLQHINLVIVRLKENLNPILHNKLKETTKQMILSIDKEIGSNYQYLNFYGELLGLDFFVSQNPDFKLIDIERELPNKQQMDFVFQQNDDNIPLFVDFESCHNINPDLLNTKEEFITFFEKKFEKKIDRKTKDLDFEEEKLLLNGVKISFILQPILWGNIEQFIKHKETIKYMDTNYKNISMMASLMVQIDEKKMYNFQFTTVSNIIERFLEEK